MIMSARQEGRTVVNKSWCCRYKDHSEEASHCYGRFTVSSTQDRWNPTYNNACHDRFWSGTIELVYRVRWLDERFCLLSLDLSFSVSVEQDWESIRVSAVVEEEEIQCFDGHWDALADRKFQAMYLILSRLDSESMEANGLGTR